MCLCCFTAILSAQYRLDSVYNSFRAGDHLVKKQVEYKDPGSNGRELTWDFSFLKSLNEEYTLDYFIPDSARMDTLCGMEHRTRYYYYQHNDSLWAIGFENATTMMEYRQPELRLKFPFAYGDTLFSYFEGTGEYSHHLPLAVKGYTRVVADAEGTLLLPHNEEVKKALRVFTSRYYTQVGKDSLQMKIDTYAWYAAGIRYPVFESIRTDLIKRKGKGDGGASVRDTTIFTTSFYYPPELQTSQVETEPLPEEELPLSGIEAVFTEAQFMPNPVESDLNISYKLTRDARIWFSVHNSVGIPVYQSTPQELSAGYHNVQVNMAMQVKGAYTLYVHVDDMVMSRVVVKR